MKLFIEKKTPAASTDMYTQRKFYSLSEFPRPDSGAVGKNFQHNVILNTIPFFYHAIGELIQITYRNPFCEKYPDVIPAKPAVLYISCHSHSFQNIIYLYGILCRFLFICRKLIASVTDLQQNFSGNINIKNSKLRCTVWALYNTAVFFS